MLPSVGRVGAPCLVLLACTLSTWLIITPASLFAQVSDSTSQDTAATSGGIEIVIDDIHRQASTETLKLWYDPAVDVLWLLSAETEPIESVHLYDLSGRQVHTATPNHSRVRTPMVGLPANVYVVEVRTRSQYHRRKIRIRP